MTSDYLLIRNIYVLLFRTWEAKFLRFKNVMNFDKATIKVYGTQRRKEKYIETSPKNI